MQWYEVILNHMESQKSYTHRKLVDELKRVKPGLSGSTYHWAISNLVRKGAITRQGYDSYSLFTGSQKEEYIPDYSNTSIELIELISKEYPYVQFTVFETVLMNDFLNHLVAQNTVFLQVEKESSIYVFRFLQEHGIQNVMYKPDKRDFDLYWSRDCVIITDLISEAPLRTADPHVILLEKMLVDMLADKLISTTYSKSEYPDVIEQAESQYLLDKARMLRYARRRNREETIARYIEGSDM